MNLLVADIGGTNGRFGLVEYDPTNYRSGKINYLASRQITLKCAEYSDMASMIQACCTEFNLPIEYACIAIAGPIENGEAFMTNLNWRFSIEALRNQLKFKKLHVINDFAAHAFAVPFQKEDEFFTLHSGKVNNHCPILVMGPGTGFGMAQLVPQNGGWTVIATEGGHASFAPTNEKELEIKRVLLQQQKHVSVENILSGIGLVNLYKALANIAKTTPKDYSPADVSGKGMANEDAICRDAVLTFLDVLGEVAGDKALSTGARSGIVITGGITARLLDMIPKSNFIERYKNKGPLVDYVNDINIRVVLNDKAALVGSAAWLIHHTPELQS
ncbi:MAG: glucokinase [Cellvibrio sp.]|nr:glucokinase [Cellvibrio sp.]